MTRAFLIILCFACLNLKSYAQFHPDVMRQNEWREGIQAMRRQASELVALIDQANKQQGEGPQIEDWDHMENQLLVQDLMLAGLEERVKQEATKAKVAQEREYLAEIREMMRQPAAKQGQISDDLVARLNLLLAKPANLEAAPIPVWGLPSHDTTQAKRTLDGAPPSVAPSADPTPLADQIPNVKRMTVPEMLDWMARNIAYTPYYGGYRSPQSVLDDGVANDVDGAQFFTNLLRQMNHDVRFVHGRIRVPLQRLQALLKVTDAGSLSNMLQAAEIPFEMITEDNEVTAVLIDRVWLEIYLPIASYRGVATGIGDQAWIPVDPMFHIMRTPDLSDPFLDADFDSLALLNAYEKASNRDADFWLETQLSEALDQPFHNLRQGFNFPESRPDLLALTLPYQVQETYGTYDVLPETLFHQVQVTIKDETGLTLISGQRALSDLYGQPIVWDSVPSENADAELIETMGGRFEVPTNLLELKPVFGPNTEPWLTSEHGVPMGHWLQLEMTVTTAAGTAITTRNNLIVGGYSMLVFQGEGHLLDPFTTEDLPEDFDPFGNAFFQVLQNYLRDTQNQTAELAQAMRVWPVQVAPSQVWGHLQYETTEIDGEITTMDFEALRLDAEVQAYRPVAASSTHISERTKDFALLHGLLAAQSESHALERFHQDLTAYSVPDLFQKAWQSAIEPIELEAFATLDHVVYGIPTEIASVYQSYLDEGYQIRFLSGGSQIESSQVYAARILNRATGRTAWLLDGSEAGAVLRPTQEQKDEIFYGARYPDILRFGRAEKVEWIVLVDEGFQVQAAEDVAWTLSYKALNSNGRPVANASLKLLSHAFYPDWEKGELDEKYWYTNRQGIATFTIPSAKQIKLNSYLSSFYSSNEDCGEQGCDDELIGYFHFSPFIEDRSVFTQPYHFFLQSGPLQNIDIVLPSRVLEVVSGQALADNQMAIGSAQPFQVLPVDQYGNYITNVSFLLSSEIPQESDVACLDTATLRENMRLWGLESLDLDGSFYSSKEGYHSRTKTLVGKSEITESNIFFFVPSKRFDIPRSCNVSDIAGYERIQVDSNGITGFEVFQLIHQMPGERHLVTHHAFDNVVLTTCRQPQLKCTIYDASLLNLEPDYDTINYNPILIDGTDLEPDVPICSVSIAGGSELWWRDDNPPPNTNPAMVSYGDINEICVDLKVGSKRTKGYDLWNWPLTYYNADNYSELFVPLHFTENKLVKMPRYSREQIPNPAGVDAYTFPELDEDQDLNCVISVPCEITAFNRAGGVNVLYSEFGLSGRESTAVYNESGVFHIPVAAVEPGIYYGRARLTESEGDKAINYNNDYGTTAFLPYVFGIYQVEFDTWSVAPLVLNGQNKLVNRVLLKPQISPNTASGESFASSRPWLLQVLARPKNPTTGLEPDQYFQIYRFSNVGSPSALWEPGATLDPDMDYFVKFAFDVESSVSDSSVTVGPEGDVKFFPLRVEKNPDLLVTDFEDHALFLDHVPPPAAGKRSAEDCYRPPSGPYFGFPVLPQRVFYFLGQDYRTLRLEAFLDHPDTGASPVYVSGELDLQYDPNAIAPNFPIESPEPPIVSPVPLDQVNGLYWRLVGNKNGIDTEGQPTFLQHLFLIGGAGIVDSGDIVRTRYIPEYTFEFDEDPSGQTDNGCLFIEREIGFSLNKEAVVTFIFDGEILVENQRMSAGDYNFPVEMGFFGRKDWLLEATFSTEGGGATGGAKEVTLTREGFIEMRRRINNKLNIGATSVKGVNLTTGSLTLSHSDLALGGVGQGVQFTRTYNNTSGENYSPMGFGWTHNYQSRLVVSGCNDLTIVGGDGSGMTFRQVSGSNTLEPAMPGIHGQLTSNEWGGYTYRTKSGTLWVYGPPIDPQNAGLTSSRFYSQNLLLIIDPFENHTSFQYNSQNGYLESIQTSDGRGLKLIYANQDGRILVSQVQTQGVSPSITVNYTYDDWGRLLSAERDAKLETYGYPDACDGSIARNNIIAYTNGNSQTTTYTYQTEDPDDEYAVDVITQISEPEGRTYTFSYADGGEARTATVSDGLATTNYTFDFRGRPTEISGPLGTKFMTWAENDVLLEEETNEAGQTITYKYDDNGNMTERSVNGAVESWVYDGKWNKPVSYTDRLGNKTTWELSVSQGYVKSMTNAENGETRYEVSERGLVTSVTDPNGNETKTSYDDHGYPVSVELPDDTEINRSFDSRGRLLSEEQPGGRTTYAYNDLDHLEEQASAVEGGPERVVRFGGLQPLGQPATKTDGQLRYTYEYDQLNRVVSEIMSPGQGQPTVNRSMTYNLHDLVTRETMDTRGGNRTYNNTYDAAGRLLSQTLNGESYRRMTYRNGTKLLLSETDYTGATTRYTYDGLLNLTSRTLATGQTEQYVHDANGNLVSYTDGDGRSETYAYDKLNRQISMTNKVGHHIASAFDANGNLLSRANGTTGVGFQRSYDERNRVVRESVFNTGGNQTTSISYSNGGLTVRTTPPEDAAITERYNMLGDLISREQNGITTGYTYDANGGVVEVRHPMGYTTTYERDGLGRPIRANLPEGYRESWDYDGYGNALLHTDRRGVQVNTTFDTYNRPLSRSYTSMFGDATEEWSYSQSNGEVTVDYTDMRGHTTTQVLDAFQRVLSIEDPLRGEATNTYSANNRTASVDFNGNSYTYRHDGLDRLLSRIGPGGELAYAYLDGSNQVSITDRRGINTFEQYDQAGNLLSRRVGETTVESHTYDKQNRPVQSVDGSGITTARTYDALGRLLTETTGPETTTFSGYDDLGRPASISDGRSSNAFTYDFYGRTLTRTNGEGAVTTMTYDAVGNMLTREVPGPEGVVLWAYQYNLLNQVSEVEDPLGNTTTLTWSGSYTSLTLQDAARETSIWNYDSAGRLTSMQRPGLGTITYQYDGNDNQVAIRFPNSSAELTYDHNNLVINEDWESGGNDPGVTIARTRDANGNLTAVTHTSQGRDYTRTLTYDHLNRPTQIADSDNLSVTIGYNGNGTRSSLALPSGLTMSYAYDAANRLTDVTVPGQGTTSYSYTNNGLVSGIDYANGMNATFDYDLASRPVLADYLRTGGERTTFSATYFADGSRESLTEDRGALGVWQTQYVYDDALRLAGFTRHTPDFERTTTYELDGVGNRISEAVSDPTGYSRERRYDLGAGHRVMGFSETVSEDGTALIRNVTYRYDGNGNRVQKVETEDGITTNHEMDWDARNRMISLGENGSPKLEMHYDDLDRRIRKIGDERGDIRYVWNELAVLEEREDLGQTSGLLASYTYGLERLTMNRVGGNVYTYTYDMGGSAADLVASNGMLVQAQTYTPFGTMEKIVETGFGGFNRLGFSGHEWDPESELTYARARYLDSDLGTFISQDPVLGDFGTPPSLHRYMYAFHNPTRFYDPDGRQTQEKTRHEKQEELEQQAAKDSQGYNLDKGYEKLKETGEDVVRVGTVILENGAELTVVGDVKTLTSEDESALSKTLATANVAVIVIGGVGYVATKFLADGLIHLRKVDDAVDLSKVNKLKRLKKVGEATDAANDPSVQRLQKLLGIGKYRKGKSTATQSVTKTEDAASTSTKAVKSGSDAESLKTQELIQRRRDAGGIDVPEGTRLTERQRQENLDDIMNGRQPRHAPKKNTTNTQPIDQSTNDLQFSRQNRSRATFDGLEVRGIRDLSHVDESTLKAMQKHGFAAKDIDGNKLILHHHKQNPEGFIVEMPANRHRIGNKNQHPYGNQRGRGLTQEERASFNEWRLNYWKARAKDELQRRNR